MSTSDAVLSLIGLLSFVGWLLFMRWLSGQDDDL